MRILNRANESQYFKNPEKLSDNVDCLCRGEKDLKNLPERVQDKNVVLPAMKDKLQEIENLAFHGIYCKLRVDF
ncbi:MAG: hypothetical protein KR126chlam5_01152 [Candidatus Anoxychlamydiales bacterium]|nr:hypothetical protein [Candidatus Anoxychlamydiales bacterium]